MSPPRRAAKFVAPSPQGWRGRADAFSHRSDPTGNENEGSNEEDEEESEDISESSEGSSDDNENTCNGTEAAGKATRRSAEAPSRGRSKAASAGSTPSKMHVTRSTSPFDERVLRTVLPSYALPPGGTTNDETWSAPFVAHGTAAAASGNVAGTSSTRMPVELTVGPTSFHSRAESPAAAPAWRQHTHYRGEHNLASSSSTAAATAGLGPGAATLASAMAEIMGGAAAMLQESMRDALKGSSQYHGQHRRAANKQIKRRRSRVSRSRHKAEKGREGDSIDTSEESSDNDSSDDSDGDDDSNDYRIIEETEKMKMKSGRNAAVTFRHSDHQQENTRSGATAAQPQPPRAQPPGTASQFTHLSRQLEALEAHQAKIAAKLKARQSQRLTHGASSRPVPTNHGRADGGHGRSGVGGTAAAPDPSQRRDFNGNFADSVLHFSPTAQISTAMDSGVTATHAVVGASATTTTGRSVDASRQATALGLREVDNKISFSNRRGQPRAEPSPESAPSLPSTPPTPWQSRDVPQPIDVSVPLPTSRALSDHARAFAAHRRAADQRCLAQVTNSTSSNEILGFVIVVFLLLCFGTCVLALKEYVCDASIPFLAQHAVHYSPFL